MSSATDHRFIFYGDACSGVPGAAHEATFAATNAAISELIPRPDFVIFAGDEIAGLTTDEGALREQWQHWLNVEMAWLHRSQIPLYNTTSNHTTYNEMSERVFADVLDHLPRNGPSGQQGLSYYVRRDDLLLVFVHTSPSALGGEGRVEIDWLASTLHQHHDARHKLVVGHHPVFPVNGFSGQHQREIGHIDGAAFWDVLVDNDVLAYLCSHILAFDVQVHAGVLQVVSAGAGTAHRMPEGIEYLHFVHAVLRDEVLRLEVIDQNRQVREHLSWPLLLPPSNRWTPVGSQANTVALEPIDTKGAAHSGVVAWRFVGRSATAETTGKPQPLAVASPSAMELPPVWIGLTGKPQRLTITLSPEPGRSPHYWFGPTLNPDQPYDFQIALHAGMGPGGMLYRDSDDAHWSSLTSASPWGFERIDWPKSWTVGETTAAVFVSGV